MLILGVTGAFCHDAAACVIADGQVIAMVEEERISRRPHALGELPVQAVQMCLDMASMSLAELDAIALSWDAERLDPRRLMPREKYFNTRYKKLNQLFPRSVFGHSPLPEVIAVDHHMCHAASAFLFSGLERAAILVVDGAGEDCCTSWYSGSTSDITRLGALHQNELLGIFYDAVSSFLGFNWTDAGKTMGLSAYGTPTLEFARITSDSGCGYRVAMGRELTFDEVIDAWQADFVAMGVEPAIVSRTPHPLTFRTSSDAVFSSRQVDLAASAQAALESCYLSLADVACRAAGTRELCIAGGVALNCVANGALERAGIAEGLFVPPAAGDSGAALGAAAWVARQLGGTVSPLTTAYGGPRYSTEAITHFLDHVGIEFTSPDDVPAAVAADLEKGRVVGWFEGRAEFGPRALGHRSILAHPGSSAMKDHLNGKVKLREPFRPYGPSVLESEMAAWFEAPSPSPYMLKAFRARSDRSDQIQAVLHVDGSSRPQAVSAEQSPRFHALISEFSRRSGVPMVLNTSFNLRGEPMVHTPLDAVRTFYSSGLDVLVLEDVVIRKRRR